MQKTSFSSLALLVIGFIVSSTLALEMIGNYDGKFYFVDKTPRTYDESATFCNQWSGLVIIQSLEEFQYVKTVVSDHTDGNRYWTAGVNTNTFKWHRGVGNSVVIASWLTPVTKTCLTFGGAEFSAHNCDGEQGLVYYPLCQFRPVRSIDKVKMLELLK